MDHEQRPASPTDPDVLAFIPDVDAAPPAASGTLSNHPLGRLFSQATSAKLLLAAAAVLVVAAVVPFLFSKKDSPKPVADGGPTWQAGAASEKSDGGPKWTGAPTVLKPSKTPAAAPEVTVPGTIPTTADLRGAVRPPTTALPTPLFGDRAVPPLAPADERVRTIPPPRTPPTAAPDYAPPISESRDTRYEARRPAPADERGYESPRPPVEAMRPMTLGDPGTGVSPDFRGAERRDYTPDYRRETTPDYRREMPTDYRQDTAADYRRQDAPPAGYRPDYVPDYRRAPPADYRSGAPAPADYRSGAAPGLADRRMTPPPDEAATGAGRPGVARIEGIIDTPPAARTNYDSARPSVY